MRTMGANPTLHLSPTLSLLLRLFHPAIEAEQITGVPGQDLGMQKRLVRRRTSARWSGRDTDLEKYSGFDESSGCETAENYPRRFQAKRTATGNVRSGSEQTVELTSSAGRCLRLRMRKPMRRGWREEKSGGRATVSRGRKPRRRSFLAERLLDLPSRQRGKQ